MRLRTSANGMIYWGTTPLPAGAVCMGVVDLGSNVGAMIKTSDGSFYLGKRGKLVEQIAVASVEKALQKSAVYAEAGRVTSETKAAAAAANGKNGGRPRKENPVRRRSYHDE